MNFSRDAIETSYAFCRRMSRRAGSSFYAGFLLAAAGRNAAPWRPCTPSCVTPTTWPTRSRRPAGRLQRDRAQSANGIANIADEARARCARACGWRWNSAQRHGEWQCNCRRALPALSALRLPPSPFPNFRASDSSRPGRRRAPLPHSPRTSLRGDRRRGDGPGRRALRDVRRVASSTASAWRRPWGWRAFMFGDFAGRRPSSRPGRPASPCN